jgi:hypothetical protein
MTGEDLARLGQYVTARRVALGYKQRTDLAKVIELTDRTLARIETEHKRCEPGTYAMVENALEWKPGSVAAILRGEEPAAIRPSPPGPSHDRLDDVSTRELFNELGRRAGIYDAVDEPKHWRQGFRDRLRDELPPEGRGHDGDNRHDFRGR